ncbi:hypothetical protein Scep_013110 [Stephania cephalantha]|uniref:Gnk2-homologous domain-containing protein n=1 Tax=Stephania cephalantha TaxID=152367 RepID=A0AAP0P738_9MAGN
MESCRSRAIKFLFLLFPILSFTTAYAADKKLDTGYTCSTDNFTTNSPFTTNLNSLLDKDSVGQNPYQLYGVLQCRGDLSSKDCASCAKNAAREALQSCTNSIWGNVWLQTCSLHYSTENLFGVLDRNATMITFDQVPDAEDVSLKGFELMDKLASSAPNKPLMFQTDVLDAGTSVKRYGMSQCRRDISKDSCETCLKASLTTFRQKIIGEREWEIYGVSCSMWYHDYSFFSDNINSKVSSQLMNFIGSDFRFSGGKAPVGQASCSGSSCNADAV